MHSGATKLSILSRKKGSIASMSAWLRLLQNGLCNAWCMSNIRMIVNTKVAAAGDLYVHADLHGAASTIVKNHVPEKAVPPLSISQAGCACVCRSAAWDAKIVTSAWWVHQHQVRLYLHSRRLIASPGAYEAVGQSALHAETLQQQCLQQPCRTLW